MKYGIRHKACGIRPRSTGFTLAELLVAVAITSVIILAVSQVFDAVRESVSRGQSGGEILANSRIIGDQIERDFLHMVGPKDGGILVIVNQRIDGVRTHEDEPAGLGNLQNRRVDQLLFICRRANEEPMTPGGTGNFNNSSEASFLRMWYGHGQRTAADGMDDGNFDVVDGANEFASDWILSRQALFLDPTGGNIKAQTALFDSPMTSSDLGFTGALLYNGISTIANYGLTDDANANGAIVGWGDPNASQTDRLWERLQADEYAPRAYRYAFIKQRLRVNPRPIMDKTNGYESWQIAQMHGYLSGHVSSFIVEFAGDYDPIDGDIDRDGDDNIQWYGMSNLPPLSDPNGFVEQDNTDTDGQPIQDASRSQDGIDADVRFVFRHGTHQATNWPKLIRIRYRLHDYRNLTSGPDGLPGRNFEQVMRVVTDD